MVEVLFSSTILFALHLALPVGLAVVGAGVVASAIRTAFQLDDRALNLAFKVGALVLILYAFALRHYAELLEFASRLWSGDEYFH